VANEFFRAYGPDAAISLTPGANGRFEVYLDGEKIYDRKEEDNKFPDLARVRQMKQVIKAKLDSLETAAAAN
jgi:predicted Rdx family selenoprotein